MDGIEQRFLSVSDVAKRIGISRGMVDILVRKGVLPAPVELTPRLKRWDRHAVDAALIGNAGLSGAGQASMADITRGIADGILAKGRLSAAKAARRRHG
ncbi:MAG: hypothetical protein JWL84_4187 [Rhodospirillales bacterium]|nr:hypothetical protein [Rhodospirillales bacterium]